MGLFIIVLMSIATVLLIRNMNKRLRRLPDSFPDQESTRGEAGTARTDTAAEQPAPAPGQRDVDSDRSHSVEDATEPEVSGDKPAKIQGADGNTADRP